MFIVKYLCARFKFLLFEEDFCTETFLEKWKKYLKDFFSC